MKKSPGFPRVGGLPVLPRSRMKADVDALTLGEDVETSNATANVIPSDRQTRLPERDFRDWDNLVKPGVQVGTAKRDIPAAPVKPGSSLDHASFRLPMVSSVPHVLIVDDEKDILELLSRAFENVGGFRVSTVGDGRTAHLRTCREMPSLVIIDLLLPGLPGLELLKALKFDPQTRAIPVVILTSKSDEVDRVLGFELGAAD